MRANHGKAVPFDKLETTDLTVEAVYEAEPRETPETTQLAGSFPSEIRDRGAGQRLGPLEHRPPLPPVCVGIYTNWLAVNFQFLRGKREPHEMARLAGLVREIPGSGAIHRGR